MKEKKMQGKRRKEEEMAIADFGVPKIHEEGKRK